MNEMNEQTNGSQKQRIPTKEESEAYFAGAYAALCRASIKARRRAIETTGYVAGWRDGKIVYDTEVFPHTDKRRAHADAE